MANLSKFYWSHLVIFTQARWDIFKYVQKSWEYIHKIFSSFVGVALSKRRAHEKKLWSHLNERLSRVGEMTIIQWKFINFMTRKIRLNFSFITNSPSCLLAHEMMQIFITATHSHNVKSLLFRRPPVQKH